MNLESPCDMLEDCPGEEGIEGCKGCQHEEVTRQLVEAYDAFISQPRK